MKAVYRAVTVMGLVTLCACADKFVLSGSPDLAGLLVVEPVVSSKSFLGQESHPEVVQVTVRKIVGEVLIEGEAQDGRFVFQGLKPGQYQLVSIATKPGKKEVVLAVPPESEEALSFEVVAGTPIYLGVVKVLQDMRLRDIGVRFILEAAPEREKAAWKALLKQSLRSKWKAVLEKHLESLS
jgi:hypothetical protein